jgi:hypothetical protein
MTMIPRQSSLHLQPEQQHQQPVFLSPARAELSGLGEVACHGAAWGTHVLYRCIVYFVAFELLDDLISVKGLRAAVAVVLVARGCAIWG